MGRLAHTARPLRAARPHRPVAHGPAPSHLAAALGLSRSTVSHELRRLEDRSLIYRNDFAVPRWRGKVKPLFAPTVQGYNAFVSCAVYGAPRGRGHARWPDRDKIELARLLRRLAQISDAARTCPRQTSRPAATAPRRRLFRRRLVGL